MAEHRRAFPRWLEAARPGRRGPGPAPRRDLRRPRPRRLRPDGRGRGPRRAVRPRPARPRAAADHHRGDPGGLSGPPPRDRPAAGCPPRRSTSSARCSSRSPRAPGPASGPTSGRPVRTGWRRQAAAAVALAALGDPEPLWPLLRHRPDPRVRSMLIQRLAADVLPARLLIERLIGPTSTRSRARRSSWPGPSRDATPSRPRRGRRSSRPPRELYRQPPPSRRPRRGRAAPPPLGRRRVPRGGRRSPARPARRRRTAWAGSAVPTATHSPSSPAPWRFRMGSPEDEKGRFPDQVPHYRKIDRSLAVSMTEVTLEQIRDWTGTPRHFRMTAASRAARPATSTGSGPPGTATGSAARPGSTRRSGATPSRTRRG